MNLRRLFGLSSPDRNALLIGRLHMDRLDWTPLMAKRIVELIETNPTNELIMVDLENLFTPCDNERAMYLAVLVHQEASKYCSEVRFKDYQPHSLRDRFRKWTLPSGNIDALKDLSSVAEKSWQTYFRSVDDQAINSGMSRLLRSDSVDIETRMNAYDFLRKVPEERSAPERGPYRLALV